MNSLSIGSLVKYRIKWKGRRSQNYGLLLKIIDEDLFFDSDKLCVILSRGGNKIMLPLSALQEATE